MRKALAVRLTQKSREVTGWLVSDCKYTFEEGYLLAGEFIDLDVSTFIGVLDAIQEEATTLKAATESMKKVSAQHLEEANAVKQAISSTVKELETREEDLKEERIAHSDQYNQHRGAAKTTIVVSSVAVGVATVGLIVPVAIVAVPAALVTGLVSSVVGLCHLGAAEGSAKKVTKADVAIKTNKKCLDEVGGQLTQSAIGLHTALRSFSDCLNSLYLDLMDFSTNTQRVSQRISNDAYVKQLFEGMKEKALLTRVACKLFLNTLSTLQAPPMAKAV